MLLCSPLMFIMPFQLPNTEAVRNELRLNKEFAAKSEGTSVEPGKFFRSILDLCRNVTFLFVQLATAAESLVVVGIGAFLPKMVASQFLLSSSQASFLTGVSVIIGAAGGILIGGVVSRNWTTLKSLRMCTLLAFIAMLLSVCILIHCKPINLVGSSSPYPLVNGTNYQCSSRCNCSHLVYKPVCGPDGASYASVCSAGCQSSTSSSSFTNCSCLSSLSESVTDGRCREGCELLPLFLVVLLLFMLFTFAYQVPTTMIIIRCVHDSQRSLAMGLGSAIYRILGAIPGPLIVGAVLDNTCVIWQKICESLDSLSSQLISFKLRFSFSFRSTTSPHPSYLNDSPPLRHEPDPFTSPRAD